VASNLLEIAKVVADAREFKGLEIPDIVEELKSRSDFAVCHRLNFGHVCVQSRLINQWFALVMNQLHTMCSQHEALASHCLPLDVFVSSSGKTIVLKDLLTKLKQEGHRVLLFSQMTKYVVDTATYTQ
jgi:SNF2 family DNA or RNA helicase